MDNITNLSSLGLNNAVVKGFLNKFLYTDCHSYALIESDGKFYAAELDRDFRPKFDSYYCLNNSDQRNAPIFATGSVVEVKKNSRGEWGRWVVEINGIGFTEADTKREPSEGYVWHKLADDSYTLARLTKTGKKVKKWAKYGEFADYCAKFHDYNF